MRILFLVPEINAEKFSGGLLTLLEYANGLSRKGHHVAVFPIAKSKWPRWFQPKFNIILNSPFQRPSISVVIKALQKDIMAIRAVLTQALNFLSPYGSYAYQRASQLERCRDLPSADISIATSYESVLPLFLYGSGEKFYFAQHFEPYFASEKENPSLAERDAILSYYLPDIQIIANSTWLSTKLSELLRKEVRVCVNAIDHKVFFPHPSLKRNSDRFIVISYGGRRAQWKGIKEMAEAVRLAKRSIPRLEWQIFGDSLLPPMNDIANYRPLGFISGRDLRDAYVRADVMLCGSWYESFPLFPLEAMACGVPVISTQAGVEDYMIHRRNGYIVESCDPVLMAKALMDLHRNPELLKNIGLLSSVDAKKFTWDRSVQRMCELLGL
jgi:glycosyltransferase involved in cell wall biosynthesis